MFQLYNNVIRRVTKLFQSIIIVIIIYIINIIYYLYIYYNLIFFVIIYYDLNRQNNKQFFISLLVLIIMIKNIATPCRHLLLFSLSLFASKFLRAGRETDKCSLGSLPLISLSRFQTKSGRRRRRGDEGGNKRPHRAGWDLGWECLLGALLPRA